MILVFIHSVFGAESEKLRFFLFLLKGLHAMKRSMIVIREILLALEADTDSLKSRDFDECTLRYHQSLLVEAGLVHGSVGNTVGNTTNVPSSVIVRGLTWEGHEFIDSVREEAVWETIKSEFKESSFETIVSVSKQLAEGFARKKVEAFLGQS